MDSGNLAGVETVKKKLGTGIVIMSFIMMIFSAIDLLVLYFITSLMNEKNFATITTMEIILDYIPIISLMISIIFASLILAKKKIGVWGYFTVVIFLLVYRLIKELDVISVRLIIEITSNYMPLIALTISIICASLLLVKKKISVLVYFTVIIFLFICGLIVGFSVIIFELINLAIQGLYAYFIYKKRDIYGF